jgi:3-oxoacyl-[acyl-carrier-protein] synthase II
VGREAFWDALVSCQSGIRPLRGHDVGSLPFPIAGEVQGFQPEKYVNPRKAIKLMCRETQMGYAAATLAVQDARLVSDQVDPERMGVVFGSQMFYGLPKELAPVYRSCLAHGSANTLTWGQAFPKDMQPLWLLLYLPNMPGCHVAIAHRARGPNNTIVQGGASGVLAMIEAATLIQRSRVDLMIVGSVGSLIGPSREVYLTHDHLTRRWDDPASACRPFDRSRDGTVAAEGAAAIILEDLASAEARGAIPLAELTGFARGYGHAQVPTGGATPEATARCLSDTLSRAALSSTALGHINAHAAGTRDGDRQEAMAIREVLADAPVTAPKSYFGDSGAGSGVLEAAVSVLSIVSGVVPPTLNFTESDSACPVNVIRDAPRKTGARPAIVLSQSTTGQVAAVAMVPP